MADLIIKGDFITDSIIVSGLSDKGSVRSNNEDYSGYYIPPDNNIKEALGSLFAVSDGVGGNAAGEVASAEAVSVLLQEYYFGDYTIRIPDRLKSVFQHTSLHVYNLATTYNSNQKMKCTLSTLLLKNNKFFISHVGDSKIFLIRKNKIIQLTKDHNLVGKLVRLGMITEEQARVHPQKNILLKSVGDGPLLLPDFYSGTINAGDVFCLMSDGITEHITAEELNGFFMENGFLFETLNKLVIELNKRGGYDNMTIMNVKINKLPC
jgi:PPM family protein phosphatase